MIILNDLHLGVNRAAGTTAQSAVDLKDWMFVYFARLTEQAHEDIIVLGDLFDSYNVSNADLLMSYKILSKWLIRGHKLVMVQGNHDISNDSSKLSSFHLLCELLDIEPVQGLRSMPDGMQVLSHVTNQDIFNDMLTRVQSGKYLLLHCNYDNHFAVNSDHSLNITKEQVANLPVEFVVFAHEHHARVAQGGKVFVCGNQFPSSISDCLGGDKFYTRLTAEGPERVLSWEHKEYAEIQWHNLEPTDAPFVRLVGACEPERAAEMATVVATYRRNSAAFIVGNAVEVKSSQTADDLAAISFEAIANFDFMGTLAKYITPAELKLLESLK